MKQHLIIIVAFSLIALWPFFRKGYFESHDGEWMVIRFTAFHQTLSSGQFPVRFVDRLNNNYGYPVLNFLYPLPFYMAEMPKLLGLGFVDSIKTVFVLSTISSVVAMYWALSQVFDKRASLAGAILYLYVPYRFVDLFVRGSLGENFAFLFIPIILGSIFKIEKGKKVFAPLLSTSICALILSHNVIALLFIPLFSILTFLIARKEKLIYFTSLILGFLASTFFWLPAIHDLKFVKLSQIKVSEISDHLVSLWQIILPSWGYGPNPNSQDGLTVQIGIVALTVLLTSLFLILSGRLKERIAIFLTLTSLILVVLMINISLPFWKIIPLADIIQFPWRLLAVIVFIQSFLAAYLINILKNKNSAAALIIVAAMISTIFYTTPAAFTEKPDGYYSTNEDTTTVMDEYLPIWVKEKPQNRADQKIIIEKPSKVLSSNIRPTNYQAIISADQDSDVRVNSIYFPGWEVKIDNKVSVIDYQNQFGLINFQLPKGEHEVIIKYTKSQMHLASELISLVALLAIGFQFKFLWPKRGS